jgi:hypothetical protein
MSMLHNVTFPVWSVVLAIATASPVLAFGPGEADGSPRPRPPHADFMVLIWYRRDDPLGTFQQQVYDVRKGEYTPAVEEWVESTRAKYPSYLVLVRPVDLGRERGKTEKLKVGSVIHRALMRAAAEAGVFLGAPVSLGPGPSAGQGQAPRASRMPTPDRSFLNNGPNGLNLPVYSRTRTP